LAVYPNVLSVGSGLGTVTFLTMIFAQLLRLTGNGPARSVRADVTDEPEERAFAEAVPNPGHDGGDPEGSRATPAPNHGPPGYWFVAPPPGSLLPHGAASNGLPLTAVSRTVPAGAGISSHGHVFSLPVSGPWQSTDPRP